MKKIILSVLLLMTVISMEIFSEAGYAEGKTGSLTGSANVTFGGKEDPNYSVRNPETLEEADPGNVAATKGPLRIDFVPQMNFSTVSITEKDARYPANAQLFKGEDKATGNFIQVSDYRPNSSGWTLQVRQETQFQQSEKKKYQLNGAVLSFDKAWTNSDFTEGGPKVSKDVIRMNNIGETYILAEAEPDMGFGTWSIVFGASSDNGKGQTPTLKERLDETGKTIKDPAFDNQTVYLNDAVNLTIPAATKKVPGTYSTVLTWIIAELP